MAWIESYQNANGKARWRMVVRAPDGTRRARSFHNKTDAERAARTFEVDQERGKAGLLKKDYPIKEFFAELPARLAERVTSGYVTRTLTVCGHFQRFLDERMPGIKTLAAIARPVLLEFQRFRLDEASEERERAIDPPAPEATEVTIAQAAQIMGYRHNAVLRLVKGGVLESRKVADGNRPGYHLIRRAVLDAFLESERYARGKRYAAANTARRRAEAAANPPPRRLKNRTINLEVSAIWTLLNHAVTWGLLDDNPIATTKGLRLPESDSGVFRALSEAEFTRFMELCPAWLFPPLFTAAMLGLREDEVRHLEWRDVDLAAGNVTLRNKADHKLKSQGKTGVREFRMAMPPDLHELLKRLHGETGGRLDAYCFRNTEGNQFPKGALRKLFIQVMKDCGIRDVTQVHALRKTFITHMAQREKNIFLVRDLARHKDIRTTQRYVTIFDDERRRAMSSFSIGDVRARRGFEQPSQKSEGKSVAKKPLFGRAKKAPPPT